jgi:hypothetical protein
MFTPIGSDKFENCVLISSMFDILKGFSFDCDDKLLRSVSDLLKTIHK